MFNKYAEYEKRRRTYLACRGVLRIKQADSISDALNDGDRMRAERFGDAEYDTRNNKAILGGGMSGSRAAGRARRVADAIGGGFEGMGGDVGGAFEHNGDTIEGWGRSAGSAAGRAARAAGEGIRRGVNSAGAYLSNAAKGVGDGFARAGRGLYNGANAIGNGIFNGLDRWGADVADNTGAHAFGLASGLGLGYLGHKAGTNIAEHLGMDQNGWKAKALKWGLAGLGGLGGYWAGTGFGKGFGQGFSGGGSSNAGGGPNGQPKLPGPQQQLQLTDQRGRNSKRMSRANAILESRANGSGDENLSPAEMARLGMNPDGTPAGVKLNTDASGNILLPNSGPTGLKDSTGKLVAGSDGGRTPKNFRRGGANGLNRPRFRRA